MISEMICEFEFRKMMKTTNKGQNDLDDITNEDPDELFHDLDMDENMKLDFDEFDYIGAQSVLKIKNP